jgi:MFS family permease
MGSELWLPLVSQYLKLLGASILVIALYGCARDLLDAIAFYLGGALGRFNTRRALLLFNALSLLGLIILLAWPNPLVAVFIALPFVGTWNSIAGPATLRVVGDSLATHRRSMAFSLQSIQKRLSSILANGISGLFVLLFGGVWGVRAGVGVSILLVAGSLLLQFCYMRTAVADQHLVLQNPWTVLRRFDQQLRQLLISDVLARWCEGMGREFLILFCLPLIETSLGLSPAAAESRYVWVLLIVLNATSLLLYIPIGHFASKPGAAKKPFIGVTFVLFALYPLSVVILGPTLGMGGLVVAFMVGGLREIGEPARKAMVTELAPAEYRTQAIGVYWASRSVAIMLAPLAGGLLWYYVSPEMVLYASALLGMLGAGLFYLRFNGPKRVA